MTNPQKLFWSATLTLAALSFSFGLSFLVKMHLVQLGVPPELAAVFAAICFFGMLGGAAIGLHATLSKIWGLG
jgi:hypothetical protein